MLAFFNRHKLVRADVKGIAQLLYKDVSTDEWDQENLRKENLDFSIDSVKIVDWLRF